MADRHPLWELADALQMDLRAATAKLVELRSALAGLELPAPSSVDCPFCGLRCKGPRTLAEHLYLSHEGTLPPQWEEADRLSS